MDKHAHFMELYTPVHARFERFCKGRAYGDLPFQDLMQETVMRAFHKLDELHHPDAFASFLFGIAIKVLANANKKKKPDRMPSTWEAPAWDAHSNAAVRQDEAELLHAALSRLPAEQREALLLFEIAGFSIREVAALQEAGESAIKQRLSRGREALKHELMNLRTLSSQTTGV